MHFEGNADGFLLVALARVNSRTSAASAGSSKVCGPKLCRTTIVSHLPAGRTAPLLHSAALSLCHRTVLSPRGSNAKKSGSFGVRLGDEKRRIVPSHTGGTASISEPLLISRRVRVIFAALRTNRAPPHAEPRLSGFEKASRSQMPPEKNRSGFGRPSRVATIETCRFFPFRRLPATKPYE